MKLEIGGKRSLCGPAVQKMEIGNMMLEIGGNSTLVVKIGSWEYIVGYEKYGGK